MARQILFPIALLSVVPVTFVVLFSIAIEPASPETPKAKETVTQAAADRAAKS